MEGDATGMNSGAVLQPTPTQQQPTPTLQQPTPIQAPSLQAPYPQAPYPHLQPPHLPSTSSSHEDLEFPLLPPTLTPKTSREALYPTSNKSLTPITSKDKLNNTSKQSHNKPLPSVSSKEKLNNPGKLNNGNNNSQNNNNEDDFQELMDKAQLDAGKRALRQLLKERKSSKKKKTSCLSLIKLYITILAALMIIGGLFTLFFLVPMIIDPALATLTYNFHSDPVLCMTTYAERVIGLKNIEWCSCTEGCTMDVYNCTQITVVYRNCSRNATQGVDQECEMPANGTSQAPEDPPQTTYIDSDHWDKLNASLYINVKGCGYPPNVDCDTFFEYYGVPGRRFWCFYSEMDRNLVMPEYDRQAAELDLVTSLGWTIGAQLIGVFIILVLHCPYIATVKKWYRNRTTNKLKSEPANNNKNNKNNNTVVPWGRRKREDKHKQPVFQRDWYDVHM